MRECMPECQSASDSPHEAPLLSHLYSAFRLCRALDLGSVAVSGVALHAIPVALPASVPVAGEGAGAGAVAGAGAAAGAGIGEGVGADGRRKARGKQPKKRKEAFWCHTVEPLPAELVRVCFLSFFPLFFLFFSSCTESLT